ncbi:lisH domain containing protein FOPNL [Echinococcus multilocularis]|uniref:LisH domain containing protein FOPNL n=1 Tax=Echinococcus multilocularis TaxID=6211 RepID=A0A068XY78_ECHMU|nr:lisH domain containing protein FOPNL [Echinococcus multilocularis]
MFIQSIVMATVSDLKNALKSLLARNGALNRIEAQAKFEVFAALDKTTPSQNLPSHVQIDEAAFIINELILEYMKFNDLRFSESVFRSEMKHKHEPMSRRLLCQSLNVKPTVSAKVSADDAAPDSGIRAASFSEKPVPLLYYFVEHFKSTKFGRN